MHEEEERRNTKKGSTVWSFLTFLQNNLASKNAFIKQTLFCLEWLYHGCFWNQKAAAPSWPSFSCFQINLLNAGQSSSLTLTGWWLKRPVGAACTFERHALPYLLQPSECVFMVHSERRWLALMPLTGTVLMMWKVSVCVSRQIKVC